VNGAVGTKDLLEQLHGLGYHLFQINQIIEDAIGTTKLDSLSIPAQQQLVMTLEDYVNFAFKCRRCVHTEVCQTLENVR
jgi:hypothetical protein